MLRGTETLSRVLLSNSRSHYSVNETGNKIVKVPVVTRGGSSQLATRGRAFHTGTVHLGANEKIGRNCLVLCIDSVTHDSSDPTRARAFKVTEFRRRPEVTKSTDRKQRFLPSSLANSDSTGSASRRSPMSERSVNQRRLFEPNENNDRLFALRAVQFTRLLAVSSTLNPTGDTMDRHDCSADRGNIVAFTRNFVARLPHCESQLIRPALAGWFIFLINFTRVPNEMNARDKTAAEYAGKLTPGDTVIATIDNPER